MIRHFLKSLTLWAIAVFFTPALLARDALKLDPANPHYFVFRGQPTVLVTSGEHYGAVLNLDFDYVTYLDELARNHLNLTRTFVGTYREVAGDFAIDHNVLAPEAKRFIAPWPRSTVADAADGENKFDLSKWNTEYFSRLRDFLREAGRRGVVVELTLFCSFYEDYLWRVSPMNAVNNVNGVGDAPRNEVLTLKHPDLLKVQEALVRKLVDEVRDFDNVYFEICNEPYYGSAAADWQQHIAAVIAEAEKNSGTRHLISQNYAHGSAKVQDPDPNVSIYNFHYSRPPLSAEMNYGLNRVIGLNETGFDGASDTTYRIQGWDFLIAGGALYNNLDYSFVVGHERGDFAYKRRTPGGGSTRLRAQLGVLRDFLDRFDLPRMTPANSVIQAVEPAAPSARALAEAGRQYAIYIHHGRVVKDAQAQYVVDAALHSTRLRLQLPPGAYKAEWIDTKNGRSAKEESFDHKGGVKTLQSPDYQEDIALRIQGGR
jgi:hypothetical protein